jgi:phenylalanyl-tRNA synthetase beta chain
MAMRFVFQDSQKTLTDPEIESMMNKLMSAFEKTVNAEIRK